MRAQAGIPVGVMVAPVIPGLSDSEVPGILEAAKCAGAMTASYTLLRLPLTAIEVDRLHVDASHPGGGDCWI